MKKILLFFLLLGSAYEVSADYLIVGRAATIKDQPNGSATIIDRVDEGEILLLLETTQSPTGYFKVKHPNHHTTGWIYRSLVRRHEGSPPGFPEEIVSAGSGGDLMVTVLDVGPGLCTIIKLPDGRYIVYDLGHWRGSGMSVYAQIAEVIPPGSPIELVVLSHTDSDHIGAAGPVFENYRVKKVLYTGYEKSMITTASDAPSGTYQRLVDAIDNVTYPLEAINLHEKDSIITPGTTLKFGVVRLVFLCGFGEPLNEWGLGATDYSKRINAVSIVMKAEYAGKSILFGGDAVGRFDGKPANDLQATEKFLVEKASQWLNSDIVISPHHGADNGGSTAFINATSPEYLIFSAGHDFEHPRQTTADRYLLAGVRLENIFRTDRGDDESEAGKPDKEWTQGRIDGCKDSYGDDDVIITITADGSKRVKYKNANALCVEEIDE